MPQQKPNFKEREREKENPVSVSFSMQQKRQAGLRRRSVSPIESHRGVCVWWSGTCVHTTQSELKTWSLVVFMEAFDGFWVFCG